MIPICVEKSLHYPNAHVSAMAYTSLTRPILTERIWTELSHSGNWETGRLLRRRSEDNGQTWQTAADEAHEEPQGERVLRWCQPVYHLDPNGLLVEFVTRYQWWAGKDDADFGPTAVADYLPMRTGRIFYRVSRDEGETWERFKNIEEGGADAWGYASATWVGERVVLTYYLDGAGGLSLKVKGLPVGWFYEGSDQWTVGSGQ